MLTGGKPNQNYPEYYLKALKIIEKDGYITSVDIAKIFHTRHARYAEKYFENQDNPLYDEEIEIRKQHKAGGYYFKMMKVFRLLKPVHDQWREELKQLPAKNGMIRTGARSYLGMGV